MRKSTFYLMCFLISTICVCCNKGRVDGKWDDNIKLSQKVATVNSDAHTVEVTTQSTYWWLNGISMNGEAADLSSIDQSSKNFIFTTSEYRVERKEDGKRMTISLKPNHTDSDRILIISMQNGDYFDGIKIIQTK